MGQAATESVKSRIEDYLLEMEGIISRKAHYVKVYLSPENYKKFDKEVNDFISQSASVRSAITDYKLDEKFRGIMMQYLGYTLLIIENNDESMEILLKEEYQNSQNIKKYERRYRIHKSKEAPSC